MKKHMKKYIILTILLVSSACSSLNTKTEELQASPKCEVWKDSSIGLRYVADLNQEIAKQKITCWVMDMFLCSYTDYTFRDNSSEVLSSLPPADKAIGKLEGDMLSVSMTGIKVEPIKIGDRIAAYELQGPVGPKQSMKVEFNQNCSKRQVAVALLSMIGR